MAVDNSKKKSTPPRPNLPPEGQPWGRWVTDTLNELKLETGGVKREVISSNKNHNAQLQMAAQQKRDLIQTYKKAEEALNIALAASGSTTIYFVAPETPEPGDIWYENVTGIWFRWVDDQWTPITDETLLEALEAILAQRIANDDKIRTFAQPDAPSGMTTEHVGDLWYDTDDKNKLYRWDGIQWVPIRDAGITEAQQAADAAQDTADDAKQTADNAAGAVSQLEAQVTADLGAMQGRLDTAEGDLEELENVTLPALNSDLGALDTALSDLQNEVDNIDIPSVDGLNKITYSTAAPSATAGYKEGDTWFRYTGTGASRVIYGQWHFTGSAWNVVALRNEMIASLDAGKITTGFLDAGRIAANSITADKLIVGNGDNLAPDPKMLNKAAWGGSTYIQSDGGKNGGGSALIPASTSQRGVYQTLSDNNYKTPVTPGETYYVEAWVRGNAPISAGTSHGRILPRAYAEDGTWAWASPSAIGVNTALAASEWGLASGFVTVPDGYTYLSIGLYAQSAFTAAMRWSDIVVRKAVGATLIEDGAVTTEKVAADAITGNKIKAGSITASDAIFANAAIQAADIGSINADTITVGTLQGINISGTTITGATITGGTLTGTTSISSGGSLTTSGGNFSVTNGSYTIFEANNLGIRIGSYGNSTSRGAISFNGTERGVFISAEEKVSGGWNGVSGASITVGGSTQGWAGAATRYGLSTVSLKAGDLTAPTGTYAIDTPGIRVTHDVKAFSWNDRHPTAMVPNGSNTSYSAVEGSVTRTSDQNISSTSLTQISLTSLNPGSSGVSLAAGGLTGYTRGVYSVEVNIQFDGGSYGTWRNVILYVNNSEFRRFATVASGESRILSFTSIVVVDTDSPSFKLYTNGGGTGMRVNSGVTMYVTRIGG